MSWVKSVSYSGEDVFDEEADDINLQNNEWKSNMKKRIRDGYVDGIDTAKDKSLQVGFNMGYREGAASTIAIGRLKGIISGIGSWCHLMRPDNHSLASVTDLLQRVLQYEDSLLEAMNKAMESVPPSVSSVSESMEDLVVGQGDSGCSGEECKESNCCKKGGDMNLGPSQPQKPCSSSTEPSLSTDEILQQLLQRCLDLVSELGLPEELIQQIQQLKKAE